MLLINLLLLLVSEALDKTIHLCIQVGVNRLLMVTYFMTRPLVISTTHKAVDQDLDIISMNFPAILMKKKISNRVLAVGMINESVAT